MGIKSAKSRLDSRKERMYMRGTLLDFISQSIHVEYKPSNKYNQYAIERNYTIFVFHGPYVMVL